jgi:hypothetical protein
MESMWENDKIVDRNYARVIYGDSGQVYEGQVRTDGSIEGEGTFYFHENGIYKGSFLDNKL